MKAVVVREFGAPSVLRIEEVPEPSPGAGEVLVHVGAAGVNPVETYIRTGTYTRRPHLPWTPGSDGAGVVVRTGPGVSRVSPGDRVYTAGSRSGTYAELCLCREAQVRRLPARLSIAQGAAIHVPYATAYRALFQKASLRLGETVLIHGATGGVGVAAVQLANAAGAIVVGTGGTEAGRVAVLEQGARHVVDHGDPAHLDQARRALGGRGFDVIVEMLADRNLDADLAAAAPNGRVVIVGSRGKLTVEPRKAMTSEVTILGMSLNNVTELEADAIHAAMADGFEEGPLTPIVREEVPLGEAPRAHELVMSPGALGKIVLVP